MPQFSQRQQSHEHGSGASEPSEPAEKVSKAHMRLVVLVWSAQRTAETSEKSGPREGAHVGYGAQMKGSGNQRDFQQLLGVLVMSGVTGAILGVLIGGKLGSVVAACTVVAGGIAYSWLADRE